MQFISSPVNPTIKYYNSLDRAKIRARDGVFLLEGDVLVREAVSADIAIVSMLVDETRVATVRDLIDKLESVGVSVYCVSPSALARASSLDAPQSILAIGRTPKTVAPIKADGRYIVCEGLQNPGNAGAILRSAAAFGMDGVFFIGSCDVYSLKVLRGSMGAVFKVSVHVYDTVEQVFRVFEQHNIRSYAAVVGAEAQPVNAVTFVGGCAVWIGNEGNGLTKSAVDFCKNKVYIPMQQHTESLNASVAASILMWEMSK